MTIKLVAYGLAISSLAFQACGSKTNTDDSVKNAEAVNEQKADQGAAVTKEDDSDFAVKAASGGMLEVELGRMAEQKASSQRVKDFGAMMVKDHSKVDEELHALASRKNITLPTVPGEDQQKHINDLSKLTGSEFDKKYIALMKDDHQEDVKAFKEAASDAKDADVKAFAARTLPTLEQHLEKVKALDKAL